MTEWALRPRLGLKIGRPPYHVAPSQRCEAMRVRGDGVEIQCGTGAAWSIPEIPLCHFHLPPPLALVIREREEMWNARAAVLWAEIMRDVPTPTLDP